MHFGFEKKNKKNVYFIEQWGLQYFQQCNKSSTKGYVAYRKDHVSKTCKV